MKRIISMLLTILILSTAFTSCQSIEEKQSITDTQSEFVVTQETESETDTTQETTTENEPIVLKDLKDYRYGLMGKFPYPRKSGDKYVNNDVVMWHVVSFCYECMDNLTFVDYEAKSRTLTINGEDFRNVAKNLLGEDFDVRECYEYFENSTVGDKYDEENDIYTFSLNRDVDMLSTFAYTKAEPVITDYGDSVTLAVPDKLIYHLDKVVDDGFLYYRLGDIYWNTDPVITDTWLYETKTHDLKDRSDNADKYNVTIELPYYMTYYENQDRVIFFDYLDGSDYGVTAYWGGMVPGFEYKGVYKVEEDYILDESIAKEINNYLGGMHGSLNQAVWLGEPDEYEFVLGKTDDGKDYVANLWKTDDSGYYFVYAYVRVNDDSVLYLGFHGVISYHLDYIFDAIKSVELFKNQEK